MKRRIAQPQSQRTHWVALAIVLALLAALPYLQSTRFDFINLDDPLYVTENDRVQQGLTAANVGWAFTTLEASNWHPLTWLSHLLDVQVFGMWAGGHHLTNVLFHAANTALLFWLMLSMTNAAGGMWRSALVAALFAIHPLHVESVAWVSERKDVLSTFFGLLAILAYVKYIRTPTLARYALIIVCFALSLLAKPMLVTLPFVLLLLDIWPLKRWTKWNDTKIIFEKLPLLALSIGSSVITMIAQRSGGAMEAFESLTIDQRAMNAIVAYGMYLWKTIWPVQLAATYPHPGTWPAWIIFISAAAILAITATAIIARKSQPHLLIGWLIFLGTLVPVIGLVQVGVQSMADRYTYVPLIGIFIMIAWSIPQRDPKFAAALASIALIALTARTFVQTSYWRDSIALLTRTLAITSNNSLAHLNLGFAHRKQGNYALAIQHYRDGLHINPDSHLLNENLGIALNEINQPAEAIPYFERAIDLRPEMARTRNNFGTALRRAGQVDRARVQFEEAVRLDPHYALPLVNLGDMLVTQRQFEAGIERYRAALAINPNFAEAHANMGIALASMRRFDEAAIALQTALALRPNMPDIRMHFGVALLMQNKIDAAIAQFRESLRLRPNDVQTQQLLNAAIAEKNRVSGGGVPPQPAQP